MIYLKKNYIWWQKQKKKLLQILLSCVCYYDQNEINKKNVFLVQSSSF